MIVRIATEGQYQVGSDILERINEIDSRLVTAVQENDEAEFSRLLADLVGTVRQNGQVVPTEKIVESDLVLPPTDTSLEEARRLFAVDGLTMPQSQS
ncbi:MAG: hypothetical protein M1118_15195 [Chloroflexi bacterium]|nr:hypothetical protein [Chloroflexota bacterium]